MLLNVIRSGLRMPALKDILIRMGWLAVVVPSIVFSVIATQTTLSEYEKDISKWVYGYINFGSFVVGVIAAIGIFWRKPRDWLAIVVSLMLVTWTSTGAGYEFWVATGIGGEDLNMLLAYFLSLPYTLLLSILILCVLLTFPDGKWTPRWTRVFFILAVIWTLLTPVYLCAVFVLALMGTMFENFLGSNAFFELFFVILPELFRLGVLVLGAFVQIYRLITTRDALHRQQIKWVTFMLVGMTFFYVAFNIGDIVFQLEAESALRITLFLFLLIFTYGFIGAFVISIFRYRLWDMDIVVNKALVYSALTTILGSLGIAGAVLFDYYAKLFLDESSPVLALFVILPLVILFVPVRDALQNFVDRHFKPEEIDFSGTMVEFSPEAQLMLSSGDILKILSRQVKEQLNVSGVEIYLRGGEGHLLLSEPAQSEPPAHVLSLPEAERRALEKGDVVVPADASQVSLYLPLMLRRAAKHEFLGVVALGRRENGVGYSSSVIKSLQKFGAEAGKVLYIAKLRENTGLNILERLASIERRLTDLKTDLA
ncbi:MAG TPA: hypothetical protein VNK49_03390 [Anaerolineales bacterium]|nr:hypothetical protein [Anaerolineales bacterium]